LIPLIVYVRIATAGNKSTRLLQQRVKPMTELQGGPAYAAIPGPLRPPAGVAVIAGLCLVSAAATLVLAVVGAVAAIREKAGWTAVAMSLLLLAGAVLAGAAGYDLLRLRNFARRAVAAFLVLDPSAFGFATASGFGLSVSPPSD
jgi:hypothetical protein